jgi:RecB family exonuclease
MPVAVEVDGEIEIQGKPVRFRADRVDRRGDALEIVDYKTGRQPIYIAKREASRHRNLIKAVREGRYLQAPAYSLAGAAPLDSGEYVFIRPDFAGSDETRTVIVRGDDAEVHKAFFAASETLTETWSEGIFFPRLVEPGSDKEPRACSHCEVAEACLRGDSGARSRLREWTEVESESSSLFHRAWFMSDRRPREEPDR